MNTRRNLPMLSVVLTGWALLGAAEPASPSRLAVIDLEANGVPPELARALTETLATRVDRTGVFETVSPVQLAAVVALDQSRWATGGCAEEDCFARLAEAVSAEHAIGGSVAKSGDTFALQLVLVEVASAKAIQRVERKDKDASRLIELAGEASIALIQPLLEARSGFAMIDANVPGAQLFLNGERSPHRVGQVFSIGAGPHVVKASMEGFYPTTVDLRVRPDRVTNLELTLVPAPETVEAYESEANLLRTLAWIGAGAAIASGVASGVFYDQAGQDFEVIDQYAGLTDIERRGVPRPTAERESFDTNQGLYLSFLGTAVLTGLSSAALFLFGPDPDRFEAFNDFSQVTDARAFGP